MAFNKHRNAPFHSHENQDLTGKDGQRSKYQVTPNNTASPEENLNLRATRPRGWGVNGQARALWAELPECAPQTPEPRLQSRTQSRAHRREALSRRGKGWKGGNGH